MFKAALKNLLGHKLRMFLTGFSIILGVSFVAGTYIFTDSISSTFNNLFSDVFAGTDLTVRPARGELGTARTSFSDSVLEAVRNVDGVSAAEPEVNGYAQFLDKEGEPIGGQGPPTLGLSWTNEPGLNPLKINEGDGRAPQAKGEVVMDKGTATANDFKVGDTVSIITNGPAEQFTVVGIATYGELDSLAGATLAIFEISEAQRVFGFPDAYVAINLKAQTGVTPEELKTKVDAVLPEGLESITGTQQSNEQLSEINQGLGFINTALLAFAGVAIFVGSFIIQNTFRIIVAQRSKELALLRAIGATKNQVVLLVIYEALFVSIFASAAGLLLGVFISSGVRSLMNTVGFTLPEGPLTIEPRTVFVSFGVGILVTLFSAILPAFKASRVSPIEAMRENEASGSTRKSLVRRSIMGAIMVLVGALALVVGLNGDIQQPIYLVGLGVVLMFVGVSVIAPLLSMPLSNFIAWPLIKTRGTIAELARDNAKRTPRRTASSAAALMIGVSLVTMLSILASTFKSEITTILADSFPADLTITSSGIGEAGPGTAAFSSQVYDKLKALPELTDVTALRYQFEGAKLDGEVIFIAGVDTESFGNVVKLDESENAYQAIQNGGIVIRKEVASKKGWSIGQEIPIEFAKTGKKTITLAGTFDKSYDTDYIISTNTYLENFDTDSITLIVANAAPGTELSVAKAAAKQALEDYRQLNVQDVEELFQMANDQIDQILSLFWALLGFAIIIAVLGITNTLMLSISERTKEIGMLRAIGMTRRQLRRMVRYESIIIALFGAVLGISMGAFFAWAVLRALASEGISGYVVSFSQIGLYFVLAIIAGILAAAWPARKAARMNILKAIYHD